MVRAVCAAALCLALVLSGTLRTGARAAETAPPGPESIPLPEPLVLHIQTCALRQLDVHLKGTVGRFARGEASDPGGAPGPSPTLADLKTRPRASAKRPGKVTMLIGILLKTPADRLEYFVMQDRGLQAMVFRPDGPDGKSPKALVLPIAHFDELIGVWSRHEVVQHLVERGEDDVFRLAYPRYGTYFFKAAGDAGVAAATHPDVAKQAAALAQEWSIAPIDSAADLRIRAAVPRMLEAGWLPGPAGTDAEDTSAMSAMSGIPPRYLAALFRVPGSLRRTSGDLWPQIASAGLDVYLADNVIAAQGVLQPRPETTLARSVETWTHPARSTPLLAAMPRGTCAFASLAPNPELFARLKGLLSDLLLDGAPTGQERGPLALRLILEKTLSAARGRVCCAYARGELSNLNALVAFETESASAAKGYVHAVTRHLGPLGSAATEGNVVLLALGLHHRLFLADVQTALQEGDDRLAKRIQDLGWFADGTPPPLALTAFYPVDLGKGMIGEMLTQSQIYGMPVQVAKLRKMLLDKHKDSPTPALLALRPQRNRLAVSAWVPIGAYMDLARMLQGFIFAWRDKHVEQVAKQFLTGWLDRAARELLKPEGLKELPPDVFGHRKKPGAAGDEDAGDEQPAPEPEAEAETEPQAEPDKDTQAAPDRRPPETPADG